MTKHQRKKAILNPRVAVLLIGMPLLFAYQNCSKRINLEIPTSGELNSGSVRPGTLTAYQDQTFEFQIAGYPSQGAQISITNKPAWLNADTTTGKLSGIPTAIQSYQGIAIQVSTGTTVLSTDTIAITVVGNPLKSHQWHLTNTGQTNFSGTTGIAGNDIHLTQTIGAKILGQGIRVAVSDSGVQESHRTLSPNLLPAVSRNYLNNFLQLNTWIGNSTPNLQQAGNAHGTAVAGLIVEKGWTGLGGRGVAPEAKFAGFLFIPAQEQLVANGLLTVAELDQYAGDFDIFNYSWGTPQCALIGAPQALKDKIQAGILTGRAGKGSIFVKAAGNSFAEFLDVCYSNVPETAQNLGNGNFSEDATTPYMIHVGALTATGVVTSYSSPGSNLWVSAPGGESGLVRLPAANAPTYLLRPALTTTDFTGCMVGLKTFSRQYSDFNAGIDPNTNCEHTSTMNGTSSAAPVTSGAIALILSANPNLSWRDVKHILATTSDQVDPGRVNVPHVVAADNLVGHVYEPGWITNAAGFKFHNWYGFGRVNVDKAVTMARTYNVNLGTFKQTTTGATWKYDSGNLNLAVPQSSAAGISRSLNVTENWIVEAIQVRVAATNCVGNLGIELTSPAGTKSVIMHINSYLIDPTVANHTFLSNAFYGESSVGTWTMKLIGAKACTTTWNSWQLNVVGH